MRGMSNSFREKILKLGTLMCCNRFTWFIMVCLTFLSVNTQAQYNKSLSSQELSIGFGGMNYLGDISMDGQRGFFGGVDMRATKPMMAISYRHNYHAHVGGRFTTTIGQICGNDQWGKGSNSSRNLHFKSIVADFSAQVEFNMLPYHPGHFKFKATPFIALGFGGMYFNPKAELNGEWVALQPLGTEGQHLDKYWDRPQYLRMALTVPVNMGVKWSINANWSMSTEFGFRYVFSDYVDDVSGYYADVSLFDASSHPDASLARQLSYRGSASIEGTVLEQTLRGNPSNRDHMFFVMFSLTRKLGGL